MVEEKEVVCQRALEKALSEEFPKSNYSVNGYKEEAICLQKQRDSVWIVYVGIRNNKEECEKYDNVVEACLGMIRKICCGNDLTKDLSNSFLNMIVTDQIA